MEGLIIPQYKQVIFEFRGTKVMVDRDLVLLYGVSTKVLKQQVKRNIERFPNDFMFELNSAEKDELVTNCDRLTSLKHSSVVPMVFTEHGVAMLSSVLRSEKAVQINIEIIRAFARFRSVLAQHEELKKSVKALEDKLDSALVFLLKKLNESSLTNQKRKKIGFELPD